MNQDKAINISDEQLSAFLDAELPEAEMEIIREQLLDDENLANRLAELAMVDEVIAATYSAIDAHPIPDKINKLLAQEQSEAAKIIAFPQLKKIQHKLQKNIAIAASIVLIAGFGLSQSFHKDNDNWQAVAQVLEQTGSGVERLAANGAQVKPRLTFINKTGDYCRQFYLQEKKSASENIACRKNNAWTLVESVAVKNIAQAEIYQTASGGSVLDEKLEQMTSSDFFDAEMESVAIAQHWAKPD